MALRQAAGGGGDRLLPGPVEKTPDPGGRQRPGKFREASWDEALDLVAGRFRHFKEQYGAQSVCWLRGMAADWGAPWDYANRLMNAFGSPNTIGNGSVCHVAREMAHVLYLRRHDPAPDQGLALHPGLGEKRSGHQPRGCRSHPCRQKAGRQTDRRRSHPDETGLAWPISGCRSNRGTTARWPWP